MIENDRHTPGHTGSPVITIEQTTASDDAEATYSRKKPFHNVSAQDLVVPYLAALQEVLDALESARHNSERRSAQFKELRAQ